MKTICYDRYWWQNDKVRLRAMKPEDWEEAFYNMFDSEARRLLQCEIELPPVEEKVQEQIRGFSAFDPSSGRLMFTAENLDGEIVGALNMNSIDEKNGTFSIGIQIGIDHRGKGYGTAAMEILLKYAFMERRLNKFNVYCLEGNIGSITMMRKLGCKQEGLQREIIYTDGRYWDGVLFGLTKTDWIHSLGVSEKP